MIIGHLMVGYNAKITRKWKLISYPKRTTLRANSLEVILTQRICLLLFINSETVCQYMKDLIVKLP